MKSCIASRCLWAVAILKSLLCLSAGPLQDYRGCSIYEDTAFRVFLNLLTTCTCWTAQWLGHCWLWQTQTEIADWQLTHDSAQVQKHKHKFETDSDTQPHSTQAVHCLQTVHCLLPLRQRRQNSCIISTIHQLAHDDNKCARNATYEISRNCPIRTALTFQCRHRRLYLSQTQRYQRMLISFEYA